MKDMEYAKTNEIKIVTRDDLLQMYLQKDEINKILKEHNGDMLDTWFGSSLEYNSLYVRFVHFSTGSCGVASKHYLSVSRAVVDLKN